MALQDPAQDPVLLAGSPSGQADGMPSDYISGASVSLKNRQTTTCWVDHLPKVKENVSLFIFMEHPFREPPEPQEAPPDPKALQQRVTGRGLGRRPSGRFLASERAIAGQASPSSCWHLCAGIQAKQREEMGLTQGA